MLVLKKSWISKHFEFCIFFISFGLGMLSLKLHVDFQMNSTHFTLQRSLQSLSSTQILKLPISLVFVVFNLGG
jgi:hypothetical protein